MDLASKKTEGYIGLSRFQLVKWDLMIMQVLKLIENEKKARVNFSW